MEKQFKNNITFFDLNIENDDKNNFPFATLYFYVKGLNKNRYLRNKAAIEFLKGHEISEEDKKLINSYFDGSIKEKNRKRYEHCKICTDKFERIVLEKYSKNYKYWEICFPTDPYTPGGLMIYLKNRDKTHIENIEQLSEEEFQELLKMTKDLYDKLKKCYEKKIVGINVLFNQISKTQLCIHGHIEPMIMNIHDLNLGCELKEEEPYEPFVNFLNNKIPDKRGIYKTKQGIRIDTDEISSKEILKINEKYGKNIERLEQLGKNNQSKMDKGVKLSELDEYLAKNLSPAPVEYIYLTYYRDKLFLSIVPELTLQQANINEIEENEKELYALRLSNYGKTLNEKIRVQKPPIIRPCIKVTTNEQIESNVEKIKNDIYNELER